MTKQALSGVRVVELGAMVAAPYCAKLLADLGAAVIKVEPPEGDPARRRGPFPQGVPHSECSALFLYLNTNKFGVTLNLEHDTGRAIFLRLVQESDLLIEDQPPGALEKLNLGQDQLHRVNPQLVVSSITPYGQTGPYKGYKAYEINSFHMGGEGYMIPGGKTTQLFPDREPLKYPGFYANYVAGLTAAIAAMAALYDRDTGEGGQYIDISKQEANMALDRVHIGRYPSEGIVETRAERQMPMGGLMKCRDGYVMLMAGELHQWAGLMEVMGHPSWAQDERFNDPAKRQENSEERDALLADWFKDQEMEKVYHQLQAKNCAAAPVYTIADNMASPQLKQRGFFQEIEHPIAGKQIYPTVSYRYSKTPWQAVRPAPLLGQHNTEVFCGRLGLSNEDLVSLKRAGTI